MSRRSDEPPRHAARAAAGARADRRSGRPVPPPARRRGPGGQIDALLDTGPGFRRALRGYDRDEVDHYVAWVDAELYAARRATDDLMARYGSCSAELEISHRLLAQSPYGQQLTLVSERVGAILQMAADEAAELTAAAEADAGRIAAEARADADARLRKAHEIKQLAMAAGDRFREEARRLRDEAAAELESARTASARIADLQAEVEDLQRQRAAARESLRRLTEQIDRALQALAGTPQGVPQAPVELVIVGNIARAEAGVPQQRATPPERRPGRWLPSSWEGAARPSGSGRAGGPSRHDSTALALPVKGDDTHVSSSPADP
jgi:cell division septum initiation protein DivIVA